MTGVATMQDHTGIRGALPRPGPEAIEIRCPSIETARSIREEFGPFTHLSEQDRRFRTVWLYEDTPQFYVDQIRQKVYQDTDDDPRPGQAPLTATEKRRINFSRTNTFHARSCKAIADYYDVRDWLAYYDHELSVDEHYEVYRSVVGEEQTLREMATESWGGDRHG